MVKNILDFIFEKEAIPPVFVLKSLNRFLRALHRVDPKDEYMPGELPKFREYMLEHCPQLVSLSIKISYLIQWTLDDSANFEGRAVDVSILRGDFLNSAFRQINDSRMIYPIRVKFVNELGLQEAGVDGGGLQRELITLLVESVFEDGYGIFECCDGFIVPRTDAEEHLARVSFAGRLLGKCIRMGMLVDLPIARYFLRPILGYETRFEDLKYDAPELYQGLQKLLEMDPPLVEQAGLTFTITINGKTVELVPNGENIVVTHENREEFVNLFVDYKFNKGFKKVTDAFSRGIFDIIRPEWLAIFTEDELSIVLGGSKNEINIEDLMTNVEYSGGYHAHHPTIKLFWTVVKNFSSHEKSLLLKFITSVPRQPILGFSTLKPKIAIRHNGSDEDYLPTSSTCLNLLKLPAYKSESTMREKLLAAINSNSGFELS